MINLTNFNENYRVTGLHNTLSTELSTEIVNNSVKLLVVRCLQAIPSVISVLRVVYAASSEWHCEGMFYKDSHFQHLLA